MAWYGTALGSSCCNTCCPCCGYDRGISKTWQWVNNEHDADAVDSFTIFHVPVAVITSNGRKRTTTTASALQITNDITDASIFVHHNNSDVCWGSATSCCGLDCCAGCFCPCQCCDPNLLVNSWSFDEPALTNLAKVQQKDITSIIIQKDSRVCYKTRLFVNEVNVETGEAFDGNKPSFGCLISLLLPWICYLVFVILILVVFVIASALVVPLAFVIPCYVIYALRYARTKHVVVIDSQTDKVNQEKTITHDAGATLKVCCCCYCPMLQVYTPDGQLLVGDAAFLYSGNKVV